MTLIPSALRSLFLASSLSLVTIVVIAPEVCAWTQGGVALGSIRTLEHARSFDLGDGNSWITFEGDRADTTASTITSVLLDSNGQVLRTTILNLEYRRHVERMSVDRNSDGSVLVSWREADPDGAHQEIRVAKFEPSGELAWPAPVTLDHLVFNPLPGAGFAGPVTAVGLPTGETLVAYVLAEQAVIHRVSTSGTLMTDPAGVSVGTNVGECRIELAAPGVPTLFELTFVRDPIHPPSTYKMYSSPLDPLTLTQGPRVLIARFTEYSATSWMVESDGVGGFWAAFMRFDPFASSRTLAVQHVDELGQTRWNSPGPGLFHLESLGSVRIRSLGTDDAILMFSGTSYADLPRSFVFRLRGSDYASWGSGAELVPSAGVTRPRSRLHPDGTMTILWQSKEQQFAMQTVELDSLSSTFYRGSPVLPPSPADRKMIDATESGSFGGVVFWGERNPGETAFEVRATVDGPIPMVREPEEFAVWTVDERATVKWRSSGAGELDVDLSLDDGATWQPFASSIPDHSDSLVFEVPDLPTESARIRVRRIDPDLYDISPSFRIRPLGAGYGKSVGDLRLAFDVDGQLRAAPLDAFSPRDVYLLARVDFADIGQAGFNGIVGLGGWEAGITLDPKILAIETELFGPGALDVSPDPHQWSVGFSDQLAVGQRWTPLMRLRLMSTAPLDGEVRIDLGASTPSSFDDPGGPGPIAGWLERPASGECPDACLRAFGASREEESLILNPDPVGVPTLHLDSSSEARIEQVFEIPMRVNWTSIGGDTPWIQCNATVVLENAQSRLQSLRSVGPGELRYRVSGSMLSFALRAPTGQTLAGEQILQLGVVGGTRAERLRPQLLNVRLLDAAGKVITPLADVLASDVTREVPGLVQSFDLRVVGGIPWLSWSLANDVDALRIVAQGVDSPRVVRTLRASSQVDPSVGQLRDENFDPLRTTSYTLEVDEGSNTWTEVARVSAPVIASSFSLSVQPNPIDADSSIRFSLGRSTVGRIEVFDLRGRRLRQWPVDAQSGRGAIAWNGTDAEGAPVAAGVYFVRLQTRERVAQQKVLVVR